MLIHLTQKAQIILLLVKKVIILTKYSDFINVFSKKSPVKFPKHIVINKHLINLELSK